MATLPRVRPCGLALAVDARSRTRTGRTPARLSVTLTAYSPRNIVHAFKLATPDDVDSEFAGWLGEAYRVGSQEHLTR
jgi:hypothetical protein